MGSQIKLSLILFMEKDTFVLRFSIFKVYNKSLKILVALICKSIEV